MKITCDPSKRQKTLEERGLDFEDAPLVFAGKHFTREDDRKDYGEVRFVTAGAGTDGDHGMDAAKHG